MIVNEYTKVIIEFDFDKNDTLTLNTLTEYINSLYENNQLFVQLYNQQNEFIGALRD